MAKEYPFSPNPKIHPSATGEISDSSLNDSLPAMLLMCTSTTGTFIAFTQSRIDTLVCVYPPALITIPSCSDACKESINSPSFLQ